MDARPRFSERTELARSGASIDVPHDVRLGVLDVACECNVQFATLRNVLWRELRIPPSGGISTADILKESRELIRNCDWPGVYDVAEALYDVVANDGIARAVRFEKEVNRLFSKRVAFTMADGQISESPSIATESAPRTSTPQVGANSEMIIVSHSAEASEQRARPTADANRMDSDQRLQASKRFAEWLVAIAERPGAQIVINMIARVARFFVTLFRSVHVQ